MIKIAGFIFFFLLISVAAFSQSLNADGRVIDKKTGAPVPNATVSVLVKHVIIYQTTSDSAGCFKIPEYHFKQALSLKITSINYDAFAVDPKLLIAKQTDNNFNWGVFEINPHNIELKEVKVKSRRRYSDTTKIDLSKQIFERSFMINDLLSGRFGFTRTADGQIYYKGKPIAGIKVNNGDFFGKNNTDIYQLLPALILNGIEVVETNIDSATNTTTLRPLVKVNLRLKEQYKNGKFGDAKAGAGTSGRYLAAADLYTYRNNQQLNAGLNANNINMNTNTIGEPKVNFAASGNNAAASSLKLGYRNVLAGKLEINVDLRGNFNSRNTSSESDRQDNVANLFSKTFNDSREKDFAINNSRFSLSYKMDSLTNISVSQSFDHSHYKQNDSLNYLIKFDSTTSASSIRKLRISTTSLNDTKINFQKASSSKRGRLLTIDGGLSFNNYLVSEDNNVSGSFNNKANSYFINGNRRADENKFTISPHYIEPFSDDSYMDFSFDIENNKLTYNSDITSDTLLTNTDMPFVMTNSFLKPGIKYHKTFNKFSADIQLEEILNSRTTTRQTTNTYNNFFNLNADIKSDYKINNNKTLLANFSSVTNYPGVQQLTSLNNSFDLVSQMSGNVNLTPEGKNSVELSYNASTQNSLNLALSGRYDHYKNKFGVIVNFLADNIQNTYTANTGSSNSGQVQFSLIKNFADGRYLSYNSNISYDQIPTILNNKLSKNNSINISQTISTTLTIIKTRFSVSPTLTPTFSRYNYDNNSATVATFIYSDKLALNLKSLQLNLYPLYNYSHSINSNSSFALNGELKKSIFKDYGVIWFQAYDIFNSFKFYNNYLGPTYSQSVSYSNLHRYIIMGLSIKFNNMK